MFFSFNNTSLTDLVASRKLGHGLFVLGVKFYVFFFYSTTLLSMQAVKRLLAKLAIDFSKRSDG